MSHIKITLHKIMIFSVAGILVCTSVFCIAIRIAESEIDPSFNLLAAELTMPAAITEYSQEQLLTSEQSDSVKNPETSTPAVTAESSETTDKKPENSEKTASSQNQSTDFEYSIPSENELKKYDSEHKDEEQYPVREFNTTIGNQSYGNIQMKNASSADIDIKSELNAKLGFTIEDTDKPQVLIYHTHTSESFLKYDTGYFYESYYPRTTDPSANVCAVGEEITKQLNKVGIKTIHDTTVHDYPSYNGAYDRSYNTVSDYLEKYPSIKVVIDIHRDGIGTETSKSKPIAEIDGKKAAQIMILAGYNYDDDETFQDWEYNLRFAMKIQNTAVDMYPDLMRPIYFADFMYNMNINTGSLLIEIGSESNTIEEVRYSGFLLGKVLSNTLKTH